MSDKYRVAKVQAGNVAIGKRAAVNSTVQVRADQSLIQADALQQVQQFIALLSAHADEIERPEEVQADAEAVEAELNDKKPSRTRIEDLFSKIAVGVAGVTTLANAVNAVHAAVTSLFT
jgi:hypothetical protein